MKIITIYHLDDNCNSMGVEKQYIILGLCLFKTHKKSLVV